MLDIIKMLESGAIPDSELFGIIDQRLNELMEMVADRDRKIIDLERRLGLATTMIELQEKEMKEMIDVMGAS